ncbi:Cold-regulated 413 inner membrane protein 2, chloroplastic-like protein [Drosera capensis]
MKKCLNSDITHHLGAGDSYQPENDADGGGDDDISASRSLILSSAAHQITPLLRSPHSPLTDQSPPQGFGDAAREDDGGGKTGKGWSDGGGLLCGGFGAGESTVDLGCFDGVIVLMRLSIWHRTRNVQQETTFSDIRMCGVLLLAKGTAVNKAFLVPLFALQAPQSIIAWMQGEYGAWSAFLALLVRIFFFIPDDLELPLVTLLFVISAPFRAMSLRSKQEGAIISLAITAYLAFQHFTRVGSLRKAFDQGSIIATVSIICITIVPVLLLV